MKIRTVCGIIFCLYASAYASDKNKDKGEFYEAALEIKTCRSFTEEFLRPMLKNGLCPGTLALYLTRVSLNPTQYMCEQPKLTNKQTQENYINRLTEVRNLCKKEWLKSNPTPMKLVRCGGDEKEGEVLNEGLDT